MTFDSDDFDYNSAPPGCYIRDPEGVAVARNKVTGGLDRRLTARGLYSTQNGYMTTKSGKVSLSKGSIKKAFQYVLEPDLLKQYGLWMGRDCTLTAESWLLIASEELGGLKGAENILKAVAADPKLEEELKIKAINTIFDKELDRRSIKDDPFIVELREEYEANVQALYEETHKEEIAAAKEQARIELERDTERVRQRCADNIKTWDEYKANSRNYFANRLWPSSTTVVGDRQYRREYAYFHHMALDLTDDDLKSLDETLTLARKEWREMEPLMRKAFHKNDRYCFLINTLYTWLGDLLLPSTYNVYNFSSILILTDLGAYRRKKRGDQHTPLFTEGTRKKRRRQ